MRFTLLRILQALCVAALISLLVTSKVQRSPRGYMLLEARPSAEELPRNAFYGQVCSPFASGVMGGVTIVLKFGAGEVSTRLPAYLDHLGRCEQDLLLFSDRKDSYGGHMIHDAIANLRPELRVKNEDFEVYDDIQRLNGSDGKTGEGWRLDKYKFLPMIELARHLRPSAQWFVCIELDTYVNWDNMHRFLTKFDHRKPHYFGSPVWPPRWPPNQAVFAHGGSGFVLSDAAMDKLVARGRRYAVDTTIPGTHLYGQDVQEECCGDKVLAAVLQESGVTLRGHWPMFNGEKPSTIPFGPEHWCEAIITLHHLGLDDFVGLGLWESSSRRGLPDPLTFEELFTYIEPSLQDRIDNWSNLSEDVICKDADAGGSFEKCSLACVGDQRCLQFELAGGVCRLSYGIRLGHRQPAEEGGRQTSGWLMNRIGAFKAAYSPCRGAHLVSPNP